MTRFQEVEAGLWDLHWSLWPHGPWSLGEGAVGFVQLIFKTEDLDQPFPRRRMAALKIQSLTDRHAARLWTEMSVLNCVRHRNIVDFYGAFAVTPRTGQVYQAERANGMHTGSSSKRKESEKSLGPRPAEADDEVFTERWAERAAGSPRPPKANQSKEETAAAELEKQRREKQRQKERKKIRFDQVNDTFCILMEYANAGTLRAEILRHPNRHLSEPGARYYMREIIAGVSYLHSKNIVHVDLHCTNVLMKYNQDGSTKRCIICDLGNCKIRVWNNGRWQPSVPFQKDVISLRKYMSQMVTGFTGFERYAPPIKPAITLDARDVLDDRTSMNCAQLLRFRWFHGPAVAPVINLRDDSIPELLNQHAPTRLQRAETRPLQLV